MRKIFPIRRVRSVALRTAFFVVLWAVLTEGEGLLSVWIVPGTAAGVFVSLALWPAGEWKWRFFPAVRFVPYFFWHSLLGGLDVAYRALSPHTRVQGEIVDFPFVLEREPARVFFLWTVSLLPGTAGVDLQGDTARIHILDKGLAGMKTLQDLEGRLAAVFGQKYNIPPRKYLSE
ncbi:MAG: Na+/H+ antiporter subunit E [Desulfonatronovibrionaceae bacterium]